MWNIIRYLAIVVVAIVGGRLFSYHFHQNFTGNMLLVVFATSGACAFLVPFHGWDKKSFFIQQLVMLGAMGFFSLGFFCCKLTA